MTTIPTSLAVLLALLLLPLPGLLPAPGPAGCTELLANGSFEAGPSGWTQSSAAGFALVGQDNPHAGSFGAFLGGVDAADDELGQDLQLPSGPVTLSLAARWSLSTEESAGVFDTMAFTLVRPDGSTIALATVDNTAEPGLWRQLRVLLPNVTGPSFRFRVRAQTDSSNPTAFFLDDVSLLACPVAGTPRTTFLPLIPHLR